MRQKIYFLILLIGIVCIIAFNVMNLIEAYGNGPPYYARTTNMDKWENPLPVLFLVELITFIIILGYCFYLKKRKR